ncbi:hypothetical protein [Leptolyngbya sp. GB1-A1]|uniref:hypothetical protein n=1 Tax=unclassified Leptolyngbya TaxID=2650499 RepID=UPI003298BAAA
MMTNSPSNLVLPIVIVSVASQFAEGVIEGSKEKEPTRSPRALVGLLAALT